MLVYGNGCCMIVDDPTRVSLWFPPSLRLTVLPQAHWILFFSVWVGVNMHNLREFEQELCIMEHTYPHPKSLLMSFCKKGLFYYNSDSSAKRRSFLG